MQQARALANISHSVQVCVDLDWDKVMVRVNMNESCPNSIDVDWYSFVLQFAASAYSTL